MIKEIKKRLKLLANGMNPSAFSRHCEIPQRSMAGWLDPKTTTLPTVENLVKIADACEVSMDWLTKGVGNKYPLPSVQDAKSQREELTKDIKIPATIEPGPTRKKTLVSGSEEMAVTSQADTKISTLLALTAKVLESDTPYSPALSANIKAFSAAVDNESELAQVKQNNLKIMNNMAKMEKRMAELEKRLDQGQGQATG